MQPSRRPTFTPARVLALGVIALLALWLAWVRFGAESTAVPVPDNATAGQLVTEPCTVDDLAADCGTLVVPENRADPDSRLIALPITRIRARSDDPGAPIFRLEGGPGVTNMEFAKADRFVDDHDVVLVGYRGVEGSSVLGCPEVSSALKRSTDFLSKGTQDAYVAAFRDCGERLVDDGVDLEGYTLTERVDDLEAARVAFGYDQVDLLSESAGTRTALIYAWRHPRRIHRSVMIGPNPPGHFLWDGADTDAQVERYGRTDTLDREIPDSWLFMPVHEGNVRLASFYGLMESSSAAEPLSAPAVFDAWEDADDGDASGFWLTTVLAKLMLADAWVWGDAAAVAGSDAAFVDGAFDRDEERLLGNPGTAFVWGGGRLSDAWPATGDQQYSRLRPTDVETLVISGELDGTTPPRNADELMPYLVNGHRVDLPGFGHTVDFWNRQSTATTALITGFLDRGVVDDSGFTALETEFDAGVTWSVLGKGILGLCGLLSLLTGVTLLWLWIKRGRFGPKASAVLRSVVPILLGFGAWSAYMVVVLALELGLAFDEGVLALLSLSLPIGLAVGWAARESDVRVAVAAAVAGGFLGFHADDGFLAVFATTVAATAAANLALIAHAVWRDAAQAATPERELVSA